MLWDQTSVSEVLIITKLAMLRSLPREERERGERATLVA
jgi:hypothetical protein